MENFNMSSGMTGEDQMAPESSMSYGALVQQSAAVLQNECRILEARIENKTRDIEELEKLCSRQAENIEKQQSECEHYKIKTHREEMQNKSHMSKIRDLREKLQVLEKHFEKWGLTINSLLGCKNELEEKIKKLNTRQEDKTSIEHFEKENKYYIEEANRKLLKLQEHKDQEKRELCELKEHLSFQLEQQRLQEKELEQELREVQSACREKEILIEVLAPQRAELQKTLENLKTELATVKDEMNLTNNQLETSLQEELNRKIQLTTEIEMADRKINEINKALEEKEVEVKILDGKHKQLNAKEGEYSETNKKEQQELEELQSTVEELTLRFSELMKFETENIALKSECDELQNKNDDYKRKISEVGRDEEEYSKKIEELNKLIEEMEAERGRTINEQLIIEDAIKKLENEQENNEKEHKDLSLEIDKTSAELQDENNQLEISLGNLREHLLEASENKKEFEKTLKNLETELARAKAISQESDFKLSSFREESNTVMKVYIEEIQILNETLQRSIEDYEKAVSDCKLNEDVKMDAHQLEIDLKIEGENYAQTFQDLQDSFAMEIENKSKLMAESRAHCEREYRNKDSMKTDALVELKETKARIIDLQKQKVLTKNEIVTKADILKKCDNLIQRMTNKFNKVAQVAITSSQSVTGPASQQGSSFATPKTQRQLAKVHSPGSDSSGRTFNPDEVELMRISHKRQRPPLRPLPSFTNNPQNVPKKKPTPAAPKKSAQDQNDDWGFLV